MRYDRERLNELFNVILISRRWSKNEIREIKFNPEGLTRAIRKLPKEGQRALEELFDLRKKKGASPFTRCMIPGNGEFIWRGGTPASTRRKGEKALEQVFILQQINYVVEYDVEVSQMVKKVEEKLDIPGEEGINYFLLYVEIMMGGDSFFYDFVEKEINLKKEMVESFDSKSLLMIVRDTFREKELIKISLFREFFELFVPDSLKMEILKGQGMKVPKELICIQGTQQPGEMTFSRLRKVKQDLFPRGPWETVESLVEGRCRKVPGLATLRRASSYEWRHSYDAKFYEAVGEKNLPNGETIPLYRVRGVKTSFTFSDIGEVLFLDHLYERGMI